MKYLNILVAIAFLTCAIECARVLKLKDGEGKLFLYSGAVKNKKIPDGEGTAWYTTYKGKWKNGLWHKQGMITFPGGASFKGKFNKGNPVSGALTNLKSETQNGKFKRLGTVLSQMFGDCKETNISPEKVKVGKKKSGLYPVQGRNTTGYYVGKVKKGSPNSKGTAFLVRYEGTWKNGKWDGAGYLYYPGGFVIKGRFENGQPAFCVLENINQEILFGGAMDTFADISCSTTTTAPPTTSSTTTIPNVPCVNCTTESGETCQFPFTYLGNGKTYTTCTTDNTDRPWCATKVDADGNYLLGVDAWGYCSEGCPSDEGYPATGTGPACQVQTTGKGFPESCAEQLSKSHKNILFLGNSYTYYNDLPGMVRDLANAAGFSASVTSQAPGGQTLGGHVSGSLGSITADLDIVVIQDQSQRPSFPTGYVYYNIIPEANAIVDAIRAKNNCTVPVFFQTWGKRDGDSQNCPTFSEDNWMCTFEGIQNRLTDSYSTFAYLTQPAKVAPAGEGFRNYGNRAALFDGDGSHPSAMGTYLTACAILETIWGVSSVGNSYQPVGDAAGLQAVAHQAVVNGTWSWPAEGGPPCTWCLGL
eukprot:TRINITY_DN10982_c0_g1_i5.p1 TRINITY_DN10982_c0_g1~~TRINITY_DN10982_c0_g1_i5.p1  ORF type:complete len:587 (-),score=157.01 TRINITY_DN10982_c0_g1_i5:46-1806(-)